MMNDGVLVLLGRHGAGKTTTGRVLAQRLQVNFDEEIGREMRKAVQRQNPSAHAMMRQSLFDAEVSRRERERDLDRGWRFRIVETWHPGNLAYAVCRSPKAAILETVRILRHLGPIVDRVRVQPLEISAAVAAVRLSECGPDPNTLTMFFEDVYETGLKLAHEMGFCVHSPVCTDELEPNAVAEAVIRNLS